MPSLSKDITVEAPAKINLALRVLSRRRDGYHDLDSIFLPLSWGDTLCLSVTEGKSGVELRCAEHGSMLEASNLASRAARAFIKESGLTLRVRIRLHKRIWIAAGLGGGSSDAAAVLRGLDQLFPEAVSPQQLRVLALGLGADVPFFLLSKPARAKGIGEDLTPLRGMPPLALVLANPGRPLSTADVFRALDLAQPLDSPSWPLDLGGDLPLVLSLIENNLEPTATELCPAIAEIRLALERAGALAVGMSGSGPTLFAVFPSEAIARAQASKITKIHGYPTAATTSASGLTR